MSSPDTRSSRTLIDAPVNPTILPKMKTVLRPQLQFQAIELNTSY